MCNILKNFLTILTVMMIMGASNLTAAASTDEMNATAVKLLNQLRQSKRLRALSWNPNSNLQRAAEIRAREIEKSFSHTRPDGSSCFTVFKQYNLRYSRCGENIACGTNLSPAGAMELWTNSPSHYKNMIDSNFREVGLACYVSGENIYWVQLFFTRLS